MINHKIPLNFTCIQFIKHNHGANSYSNLMNFGFLPAQGKTATLYAREPKGIITSKSYSTNFQGYSLEFI